MGFGMWAEWCLHSLVTMEGPPTVPPYRQETQKSHANEEKEAGLWYQKGQGEN